MAYIGNPNYLVHIYSKNPSDASNVVNVFAPMPESFTFDTASQYEAPFTQGLTGNSTIDTFLRVGGMRFVSQNLSAQFWQGSSETELGLQLEFHAESDPASEVRDPIVSLMKLTTPGTMGSDGFLMSPGPQISSEVFNEMIQNARTSVSEALGEENISRYDNYGIFNSLSSNNSSNNVKMGSLADPSRKCTNGNNQLINTTSQSESTVYGQTNSFRKYVKNQISIRLGNFALFDSVVITNVQKTYESKFDALTGLPLHARVDIRFKPLFMIVKNDLNNIFYPSNGSILDVARSVTDSAIDAVSKEVEAFPVSFPSLPSFSL